MVTRSKDIRDNKAKASKKARKSTDEGALDTATSEQGLNSAVQQDKNMSKNMSANDINEPDYVENVDGELAAHGITDTSNLGFDINEAREKLKDSTTMRLDLSADDADDEYESPNKTGATLSVGSGNSQHAEPKKELIENVKHGTSVFPFAAYIWEPQNFPSRVTLHWHREMELVRFSKGSYKISVDMHNAIIKDDAFLLLPGNIMHTFTLPAHCEESAIVFDPKMLTFSSYDEVQSEIFESLISSNIPLPPIITPEHPAFNRIDKLYRYCVRHGATNNSSHRLLIKAKLLEILAVYHEYGLLSRKDVHTNVIQTKQDKLKDLLNYIDSHYAGPMTIRDAAIRLGVTDQYFCRYFKRVTGMSFTEYLNDLRLRRAAKEIELTTRAISDIAYDHGFENAGYFFKSFKSKYGITPLRYRKRHITENSKYGGLSDEDLDQTPSLNPTDIDHTSAITDTDLNTANNGPAVARSVTADSRSQQGAITMKQSDLDADDDDDFYDDEELEGSEVYDDSDAEFEVSDEELDFDEDEEGIVDSRLIRAASSKDEIENVLRKRKLSHLEIEKDEDELFEDDDEDYSSELSYASLKQSRMAMLADAESRARHKTISKNLEVFADNHYKNFNKTVVNSNNLNNGTDASFDGSVPQDETSPMSSLAEQKTATLSSRGRDQSLSSAAAAALFGNAASDNVADEEAVVASASAPVDAPAPKRRGRRPGSKNAVTAQATETETTYKRNANESLAEAAAKALFGNAPADDSDELDDDDNGTVARMKTPTKIAQSPLEKKKAAHLKQILVEEEEAQAESEETQEEAVAPVVETAPASAPEPAQVIDPLNAPRRRGRPPKAVTEARRAAQKAAEEAAAKQRAALGLPENAPLPTKGDAALNSNSASGTASASRRAAAVEEERQESASVILRRAMEKRRAEQGDIPRSDNFDFKKASRAEIRAKIADLERLSHGDDPFDI